MLSVLPTGADENLLIGLESPDDAAVYAIDSDRTLVATVDFFTPVVDDPEDFGAIAAANSLSDLYAMGARPAFALSVLAVPATGFPVEWTAGILRGAAEVCSEAGIVIAGGHTIDDAEPKFGLVGLGFAHPTQLRRKSGARPGDSLVLGKALGTGVIATAIKREAADQPVIQAAVRSMRQLNAEAAAIAEGHDVHAMTDVTGYGLMGHLKEMCDASEVSARVIAGAPRLLPDAERLAEEGFVPGGSARNREFVGLVVDWADEVTSVMRDLLCDAQTSGGLLAALAASDASELAAEWEAAGYASAVIGSIEPRGTATMAVEA